MAQPSQVESKFAGKRLLIVDDDADMRLLLAEYFRRLGFDVDERDSGNAALQPATTGKFDCFIFDVSMPGMSGFDLLKRARERGVKELFAVTSETSFFGRAGFATFRREKIAMFFDVSRM